MNRKLKSLNHDNLMILDKRRDPLKLFFPTVFQNDILLYLNYSKQKVIYAKNRI